MNLIKTVIKEYLFAYTSTIYKKTTHSKNLPW